MATLPLEDQTQVPTTGDANVDPEEAVASKDPLFGNLELQGVVRGLAKHFIGLDKWVRRQEVIESRRARFYWRSDQYIYWKSDSIGFIPAVGGTSLATGEDTVEIPRYTDVYNIYTPYGESLLSTLIQNPPGINWQPVDGSKSEDITAKDVASKYQQVVEKQNDRKALQSDVSRFFFTDGRTLLYSRHEDLPNGSIERITAHGVLETKVVPITANEQKDLVAVIISTEIDIYKAKEDYPDAANEIVEGTSSLGESSYERIARLGVLQGTRLIMQAGDAFAHMVTNHVVFLRASTFRKAEKKYWKELKELFPNGLKVIFTGDAYCGSENRSMDDQIGIGFPTPGDGMSRPALGKRILPLQDTFNDEINLWHEAHDFCVPTLFMYSETGDIDAVRDTISQPGNIVPFTALPPGASSAESAFYAAVLESVPATLPQLIQFIQGPLAQFISGAFPALFGGDTGENDTAKGIAIQRDQAMGRMGLPWGAIQYLFATCMEQSVRSAVEHSDDGQEFNYTTHDQGGNEVTQVLSVDDLKNGSFKCVPDTDASFPETTNAKRQTFQMLMASAERNPLLADIINQPDNLEYGHEIIGLPDLVIPGAEARNKQLMEISQLLKEPPIPPSMEEVQQIAAQQAAQGDPTLLKTFAQWEQKNGLAVQSGQPPIPPPIPEALYKPSIDVDPVWDFHQYEAQKVKDWLSSSDRRKEDAIGNTKGILNVRLHGAQHLALVPPPQPAPTPAPKAAGKKLQAAPKSQPQAGTPAPGIQ